MKILPLNKFRRLKEFKKYFKIDENSIIAYDNIIYTNKTEIPEDIILHEQEHFKQQNKYGLITFTKKYLNNKEFRLEMEGQAYKIQLDSIKDEGLREAVKKDIVNNLTSGLYGKVTLKEAKQVIK